MKCDKCKRTMNYAFYIPDKYWHKAVGKRVGHQCPHCILDKLGGNWQLVKDRKPDGLKKTHIIPVNDLRGHIENIDCWCKPKSMLENETVIIAHNAQDEREYPPNQTEH